MNAGPGGFVTDTVAVSVPATSANLGPGFDALGLALDLRDRLEAQVRPAGLEVEVSGVGTDVPRDERHLVVRAMRATFDVLGAQPPGLRLSCANAVPHARGLGSSSAAIVAGVCLARALTRAGQERLDDAAALDLAARLEGHPDNVAPALLGGFVVAGQDDEADGGGFYAVPAEVASGIGAVALVPPTPVSTEAARGLLPAQVPHADAARNAGRAALLVAALAGRPEQLLRATDDRLHQRQREPAMPESLTVLRRLRAAGHAALVSGAGPTVLVLHGEGADVEPVLASCPASWQAHRLEVDRRGAVVEVG